MFRAIMVFLYVTLCMEIQFPAFGATMSMVHITPFKDVIGAEGVKGKGSWGDESPEVIWTEGTPGAGIGGCDKACICCS